MKIIAKMRKERKDGSAICELDLDREAKDWLIGEGFVSVLSKVKGKGIEAFTYTSMVAKAGS